MAAKASPHCKGQDKVSQRKAGSFEDLLLSSVSPHMSDKMKTHLFYLCYHVL